MQDGGDREQNGPAITIGLPVCNGENYIREAIDSVLAQTFGDFDLLISDNASSDATENICRAYARRDPRIRYIRQESNIGAIANFKFVAGQARAPLFSWLAHDDRLRPEYLKTMTDYFARAGQEVVLTSCDFAIISPEGEEIGSQTTECLRETIPWEERVYRFFDFPQSKSNAYTAIYGVMRTDICQQVLRESPDRKQAIGGEAPILCRFAAAGEIVSLPFTLRELRWHGKNLSITEKARLRKKSWLQRLFFKPRNWAHVAGQLLSVLFRSRLPLKTKIIASWRIISGFLLLLLRKIFRIKGVQTLPWRQR